MLPKTVITYSLLLLAMSAVSEETKLSFHPAPKVGDKSKASYELKLNVQGTNVVVAANYLTTVSAIEDAKVTSDVALSDFSVAINDENMNIPNEPYIVQTGGNGDILKLTGGIPGSDSARTFLLTHFPMPDKELQLNVKYTFKLPQVKSAGVPARTIEETYKGKDIVNGSAAHKVVVKLQEVEGEELSEEATYWLLESGKVVKVTGTFTNLPIPQAGGKADGEVKYVAQ